MKKVLLRAFLCALLIVVSASMFTACSGNGAGEDEKSFSSVVFNDLTIDYDGNEHTIVATGVPEGATVTYTNEGPFVNANTYTISVSISAQGYNTYTKDAKLTINKINFPLDIKFESEKTIYTGTEKVILVSGEIPDGTQIEYKNNKATQAGTYEASATLKNPNYNTKTLNATLTIIKVVDTAKGIIDGLLQRPDAWSFMPEAFSKENLSCTSNPSIDFTSFVNVNNINNKFIGKQMFVLWEGVRGMDTLLEKFDVVYAIGETIVTAYQAFINDNPENYAEWTKSIAGFNVKILLKGSENKILVGNNIFSLELFADTANNINKGRIEIAQGGILNYEMQDEHLKFNVALAIKGVMVMKQVEFIRTDNEVSGYFYEYMGSESVAIKTSAVIAFNDDYAIVASAKRESDDLFIKGYEEVYSAKTGEFLAAEVIEDNKLVEFDTYWVNIFDVAGITSLKAVDNGDLRPDNNHHDIYLNNSSTKFEPAYNKILGVNTSRKFDIEMKTVYYVVKTIDGENENYSVVETEIPMLFVQNKNAATFSADIITENTSMFTSSPILPSAKMQVANANIDNFVETLEVVKEVLTYQELKNQLGVKDPFFN